MSPYKGRERVEEEMKEMEGGEKREKRRVRSLNLHSLLIKEVPGRFIKRFMNTRNFRSRSLLEIPNESSLVSKRSFPGQAGPWASA